MELPGEAVLRCSRKSPLKAGEIYIEAVDVLKDVLDPPSDRPMRNREAGEKASNLRAPQPAEVAWESCSRSGARKTVKPNGTDHHPYILKIHAVHGCQSGSGFW